MTSSDAGNSRVNWPEAGSYRKSIRLEFSLYVSSMILVLMSATGYLIKEQQVETATRNVKESLLVQARS